MTLLSLTGPVGVACPVDACQYARVSVHSQLAGSSSNIKKWRTIATEWTAARQRLFGCQQWPPAVPARFTMCIVPRGLALLARRPNRGQVAAEAGPPGAGVDAALGAGGGGFRPWAGRRQVPQPGHVSSARCRQSSKLQLISVPWSDSWCSQLCQELAFGGCQLSLLTSTGWPIRCDFIRHHLHQKFDRTSVP
jgi:hypothetical protein